nr:hypothetical protein [Tanacetum cinerariifolium]
MKRFSSDMRVLDQIKGIRPGMAANMLSCCPAKIRVNFSLHDPATYCIFIANNKLKMGSASKMQGSIIKASTKGSQKKTTLIREAPSRHHYDPRRLQTQCRDAKPRHMPVLPIVSNVRISEDNIAGNTRKTKRFWVDIMNHMHANYPIAKCRTYDMLNGKWKTIRLKVASFLCVYDNFLRMACSGASDGDFLQKAQTEYQVEYGILITLFVAEKDQAKRKGKVTMSSTSLAAGVDVEVLARLMVNENAMANDPYDVQKGENLTQLLEIKNMKLALKDREQKIREIVQRQKDEVIYMLTTDEELMSLIKARWNLTF